MRQLNEIPKLTEAIRYLNQFDYTNPPLTLPEDLRKNFGYNYSVATDVILLWVESAQQKSPITFLSE